MKVINVKLKSLFADAVYDALINGRDYDEEILEIYEHWFSDDEPEDITWDRICMDIEDKINAVILGGVKFEEVK